MFFVYILYSKKSNSFYKGQTCDLDDRLRRHNAGYEKATAKGTPWELVWYITKKTRSEAVILERKLKNLSHSRIERFVEKYKDSSSQ